MRYTKFLATTESRWIVVAEIRVFLYCGMN
jgi:hypothetical protein